MSVLLGAFDPSGVLRDRPGVAVEMAFARADDPYWATQAVGRIIARGRTPILTCEPWRPELLTRAMFLSWRASLTFAREVFVRLGHEMNGSWYPWNRPGDFLDLWTAWRSHMPSNVRMVWCPNVAYPGSRPMADYWPGAEHVDVVALDGYARHGETVGELFGPSLAELRALAPGKPVWIGETGTERGRRQAVFARALREWAAGEEIAACVWFNEDKSHLGGDERDWSLTERAADALFGAKEGRHGGAGDGRRRRGKGALRDVDGREPRGAAAPEGPARAARRV